MSHQTFRSEALDELYEIEVDGEVGFVRSLCDEYKIRSQNLLEALRRSSIANDFKSLEIQAHSLKSSSKALGLDLVADVCFKLELLAHDSKTDASMIESLVPLNNEAVEALFKFINNRQA